MRLEARKSCYPFKAEGEIKHAFLRARSAWRTLVVQVSMGDIAKLHETAQGIVATPCVFAIDATTESLWVWPTPLDNYDLQIEYKDASAETDTAPQPSRRERLGLPKKFFS